MLMVTTTVRLGEESVRRCRFAETGRLTWSTGFMATPRVLGHELRLTANLCLARDASVIIISTSFQASLVWSVEHTHQRLVSPATARDNPDHAPHRALDHLLRATRQLHPRLALIRVVPNDGDIVPARPAQRATIANLLLHVRHHRTFRHLSERQDVADVEGGTLAGVDELAGVHALVGDEGLGVQLEAVRVAERHSGEGGATAGVVDDVFDDAAEVAMALAVVVGAELGGVLVEACDCGIVSDCRVSWWVMGVIVRVCAVKMDPRPFL